MIHRSEMSNDLKNPATKADFLEYSLKGDTSLWQKSLGYVMGTQSSTSRHLWAVEKMGHKDHSYVIFSSHYSPLVWY